MTKLMKFTLVWCATWYSYEVCLLAKAAYHGTHGEIVLHTTCAAIQAGLFIALLYMNRSAQRIKRIQQMMGRL